MGFNIFIELGTYSITIELVESGEQTLRTWN